MHRAACIFVVLVSVGVLAQSDARQWEARHLEMWSRKSGLSVVELRQLETLAGYLPGSDSSALTIAALDSKALSARHQILIALTQGTGYCLDIFVFQRGDNGFSQLWKIEEQPDGTAGFCKEGNLLPQVVVRSPSQIVITAPVDANNKQQRNIYRYAWDGKTYVLRQKQYSR